MRSNPPEVANIIGSLYLPEYWVSSIAAVNSVKPSATEPGPVNQLTDDCM